MNDALAVGLLVGVIGIVGVFRGLQRLPLLWHVLRANRTTPDDATDGPALVSGTALRRDDVVEASFTDAECLAAERITYRYRNRGRSGDWKEVRRGETAVPFDVRGEMDAVRVVPDGGELLCRPSYESVVDGNDGPPESENRPVPLLDGLFRTDGDHRYVERRLDEDEPVRVLGTVRRGADGRRIVDAADERSSLLGRLRHPPLVIAPTDGVDPTRRRLFVGAGLVLGGLLATAVGVSTVLRVLGA